jgi:hypothetical protein
MPPTSTPNRETDMQEMKTDTDSPEIEQLYRAAGGRT